MTADLLGSPVAISGSIRACRRAKVRSDVIRVADASDIEVVEALRYAALSASAPSVYSPREVIELLDGFDADELRAMVTDRQLFVVAETDGLIVGSAGWRGKHLRHVYVAPGAQRCYSRDDTAL